MPSNISQGFIQLTVDKEGRLSLWDTRRSAAQVKDEVAFSLELTKKQLDIIEQKRRGAEGLKGEVLL